MKKAKGRPRLPGEKRSHLVAFYLTETDHTTLKELVRLGKFKSPSTLITSIIEPIIQDRLSVKSAALAIGRVQEQMKSNGALFTSGFKELGQFMLQLFTPPTPPPPHIADEMLDDLQLAAELRVIADDLEAQHKTKHTNTNVNITRNSPSVTCH